MKKAIDVSKYQGIIDWDAVKASGVEFAIIRGGLGDDIKSQDDEQFERNWSECQRVGIACTMYLFSYAAAKGGDISSELAHIKRLMSGKKMNCTAPIYIDVENTSGLNWRSITNEQMLDIFKRYKAGLAELGFGMGIYSSRSAFWNEKMGDPWYAENVSIWVAEYATQVNNFSRPYDLWQYSSSGKVNGINGRVDIDWLYADFSIPADPTEKEKIPVNVTYQVFAKNVWLPNVVNKEDYAGVFGKAASGLLASPSQGYLIYKVGLLGGGWLPEVKSREDYAGILGKPFDRVMVRSTLGQKVYVQAHADGRWLTPVCGYDENDFLYGYAGIPGKPIDGLYIWSDPLVEQPAEPVAKEAPEDTKQEPVEKEPEIIPDPNPPLADEEVQRLEDLDNRDEAIDRDPAAQNSSNREEATAPKETVTQEDPPLKTQNMSIWSIILEWLRKIFCKEGK